MKFTLHQNSPVTPPNAIHSIWAAVNRVTREGNVIGADQKISVMDAIKDIKIVETIKDGKTVYKQTDAE